MATSPVSVCLCGHCEGKTHPLKIEPGTEFVSSPDCIVSMVKRALGNLRCPNDHVMPVFFSSKIFSAKWMCDVCRNHDPVGSNPVFCCLSCDYAVCARCAALASVGMKQPSVLEEIYASGFRINAQRTPVVKGDDTKLLYCGRRYGHCLCRSCKGVCGPDAVCPCQVCHATFEMIALSIGFRCSKGHLLTCTLYKSLPEEGVICNCCGSKKKYEGNERCSIGLACEVCGYAKTFVCPSCIFDAAEQAPLPASAETGKTSGLGVCSSCSSSQISAVFVPCGHACMCSQCAEKWYTDYHSCPICREVCDGFTPLVISKVVS